MFNMKCNEIIMVVSLEDLLNKYWYLCSLFFGLDNVPVLGLVLVSAPRFDLD